MTEEEQKARENIEIELNKKYEVVPLYKDFSINSPMNIVQKHYNDTDIKIILNLISKLQADIEIKDKVIDLMAKKINEAYFEENNMWVWFEKEIIPKNEQGKFDYKDIGTRKQRIKQYFYKQVEKVEEEKC